MSTLYSPQLQDTKKISLPTQYEYLKLLRRRHVYWMDSADDPNIRLLHLDIANLIQKTVDQYNNLLNALEEQRYEE